jgi:hypothetical protein
MFWGSVSNPRKLRKRYGKSEILEMKIKSNIFPPNSVCNIMYIQNLLKTYGSQEKHLTLQQERHNSSPRIKFRL